MQQRLSQPAAPLYVRRWESHSPRTQGTHTASSWPQPPGLAQELPAQAELSQAALGGPRWARDLGGD